MNRYYGLRWIIVVGLSAALCACKAKDSSSPGNLSKGTSNANDVVQAPPKSGVKEGAGSAPIIKTNGQKNAARKNDNDEDDEKDAQKKSKKDQDRKAEVPLGPEALPPPPPPPVDGVGGIADNEGPIYSQCGNGVVDRVVNRVACPPLNPASPFCPGFLYLEQCDDGNTLDNDGCSSVCLKECCGNGIVEEGEQCDMGQNSGYQPPNLSPPFMNDPDTNAPYEENPNPPDPKTIPGKFVSTLACANPALVTDTGNCSKHCQLIICGDGIVNGPEQCDDGNDLSCDGCFKCILETKDTCPCNCVPPPL